MQTRTLRAVAALLVAVPLLACAAPPIEGGSRVRVTTPLCELEDREWGYTTDWAFSNGYEAHPERGGTVDTLVWRDKNRIMLAGKELRWRHPAWGCSFSLPESYEDLPENCDVINGNLFCGEIQR